MNSFLTTPNVSYFSCIKFFPIRSKKEHKYYLSKSHRLNFRSNLLLWSLKLKSSKLNFLVNLMASDFVTFKSKVIMLENTLNPSRPDPGRREKIKNLSYFFLIQPLEMHGTGRVNRTTFRMNYCVILPLAL